MFLHEQGCVWEHSIEGDLGNAATILLSGVVWFMAIKFNRTVMEILKKRKYIIDFEVANTIIASEGS